MHYHVVHQGVDLHLEREEQPVVGPSGSSLYKCMLSIARECRDVDEMQNDILAALQGNPAYYENSGASPCSSKTPVDVMLQLGAFTTLYACTINLWGVKEDEKSLMLLGVASHGTIIHHIILVHGVYHMTKVLPFKSHSGMCVCVCVCVCVCLCMCVCVCVCV